jgi:hypothetical protein
VGEGERGRGRVTPWRPSWGLILRPQSAPAAGVGVASGGPESVRRRWSGWRGSAVCGAAQRAALENSWRSSAPSARPSAPSRSTSDQCKQAGPAAAAVVVADGGRKC